MNTEFIYYYYSNFVSNNNNNNNNYYSIVTIYADRKHAQFACMPERMGHIGAFVQHLQRLFVRLVRVCLFTATAAVFLAIIFAVYSICGWMGRNDNPTLSTRFINCNILIHKSCIIVWGVALFFCWKKNVCKAGNHSSNDTLIQSFHNFHSIQQCAIYYTLCWFCSHLLSISNENYAYHIQYMYSKTSHNWYMRIEAYINCVMFCVND